MLRYVYTMGVAQNQAVMTTSSRCWMSLKYTFIAARKTPSAAVNMRRASSAGSSRGRYEKLGTKRNTTRASTMTMAW